jgi:hypothetical protein
MGQMLFAVPSETFRTVREALSWLLDTPWCKNTSNKRERNVAMEERATPPTFDSAPLSLVI